MKRALHDLGLLWPTVSAEMGLRLVYLCFYIIYRAAAGNYFELIR